MADLFTYLLLLLSIVWCFKPFNPPYVRLLFIYCTGNALATSLNLLHPQWYNATAAVFTLFELFFFAYLLHHLLRSRWMKRILWVLIAYYLFRVMASFVREQPSRWGNMVLVECIILIPPCLVFLREVFRAPAIADLETVPAFWIVSGILFYFVSLIPAMIVSSYYYQQGDTVMGRLFYSINNYAEIITYCMFIKGMICRKKSLL